MKKTVINTLLLSLVTTTMLAQSVNIDVNLDMVHSVGGISDFGRERHITLHSALGESDWNGEAAKMDYLMNTLDVYFGRDNGSASWKFQATIQDPANPWHPSMSFMETEGVRLKTLYDATSPDLLAYEARSKQMIMGTNPHPTYPTLSYNYYCGVDPNKWFPKDIQTSADWMVQYLDKYFAHNESASGEPLPMYWEVINEPDMLLNTGQFMFSSWESIWEYHNKVAIGVKARMGNQAPKIGGMTWGLHDLFMPDLGQRYPKQGYTDNFYGSTAADATAKAEARVATTSAYWGDGSQHNVDWYQWDVLWKGFVDAAGANMDFYSVHLYDWPEWKSDNKVIRAGGHVEATLDMLEWYDVNKFGVDKRKPIVISEYGAVGAYIGQSAPAADPQRRDWENLKPFNSMLMQFLERPDYIVKSMPFTPVKAVWGDWSTAAKDRYPYTMMDKDASGKWQWSEFIKFYELWSDVDGTRIDTYSGDRDIQVDSYVKGNKVYLILNNLDKVASTLSLNLFGANGNSIVSVKKKYLFLDLTKGTEGKPALTTETLSVAPTSVVLDADATMILEYSFANPVTLDQFSKEKKFYGNSLTGGTGNHRVTKSNNAVLTANINNVVVPTGAGEAVLRICGKFFYDHVTTVDARNIITVNGTKVPFNPDWRGRQQGTRNVYFGTLEVPVDKSLLKKDNVITVSLLNENVFTNVTLQVFEMSRVPNRSGATNTSSVIVTPTYKNLQVDETQLLSAKVTVPSGEVNTVKWKSSNEAVATVSDAGLVRGISNGMATITATLDYDTKQVGACSVVVGSVTSVVKTNANLEISLYPNPTTSRFVVGGLNGEVCDVRIFSLQGREFLHVNGVQDQSNVDVSALPSGMYIVQVSNASINKTIKLNKK